MSKLLKKYYISKEETQQDEFLKAHSNFDGRGIKIGIIDSGVDVSLDGLIETSEGLPKIIDCFDFTDAGNVETSIIKTLDSDNILIGLSGRSLKIPSNWKNPSGNFYLGIKSLYKPKPFCTPESLKSKILESEEKLPEIDSIVWFDGQKWVAVCADISLEGNLENAKVLQNYRDEHEYSTIFENITFCVTIHNEGNLLEIFMPYDSHGSAVAQVAAAHFKNELDMNGLAPGAQIISINIHNPFFDKKIYENAFKKAVNKCIDMKVNIINCSMKWCFRDLTKTMKMLVEKKGIIFVKAAGNMGPVFSFIGRMSVRYDDFVINIGAAITEDRHFVTQTTRYQL